MRRPARSASRISATVSEVGSMSNGLVEVFWILVELIGADEDLHGGGDQAVPP